MTIGQRNNNPLNIRRGKTLWKGEAPQALPQRGNRPLVAERLGSVSDGGQSGKGAFCRFSSVEWGIRAAFCLLRTYRNKYKAVCIEDIITRWAPPSENDTRAYIEAVCRLTGFGGEGKAHRKPVAEARQGNGCRGKPLAAHGRAAAEGLGTVPRNVNLPNHELHKLHEEFIKTTD